MANICTANSRKNGFIQAKNKLYECIISYVQYKVIDAEYGIVEWSIKLGAGVYQVVRSVDICPCLFKELFDKAAADIAAADFNANTVSSAKGSAS